MTKKAFLIPGFLIAEQEIAKNGNGMLSYPHKKGYFFWFQDPWISPLFRVMYHLKHPVHVQMSAPGLLLKVGYVHVFSSFISLIGPVFLQSDLKLEQVF